jgi:hypothetical protein
MLTSFRSASFKPRLKRVPSKLFCITSNMVALVIAIPVIIPTYMERPNAETATALWAGSTTALMATKTAVLAIPAARPLDQTELLASSNFWEGNIPKQNIH